MNSVITVNHLSKKFGDQTALSDLSFSVKEGEIFGFLGPSGAGKTTTIKILTAQLMPSGGEASVLGQPVHARNKEARQQVGILTDNSGLYERLSVMDNLKLFAEIHGVTAVRIEQVLEQVGLLPSKKKEAKKLSRGMKQRLMLARAVLHQPKLLFLDEPTAALDPGTTLAIHRLLRQLNKEGTTIFLTTHNMEEADKLCHRVAFLHNGAIVESGKPQDLKIKHTNNMIQVILKEKQQEMTVENNANGAAWIQQWMAEGKIAAIHSTEPNLEEIFLTLTGRTL